MAAPVVVAVSLFAAAFVLSELGPLVLWAAQAVLALTAGLAAVSVAGREWAMELQLTLPASYPVSVLRRLAPAAGSVFVAGALPIAALALGSPGPDPFPAVVAAWASCGLCMAAGLWGTVRTGSAAAGSGLVMGVWSAKVLFVNGLVVLPLPQAALVAPIAALLLWLVVRRLGDAESLMEMEKRRE